MRISHFLSLLFIIVCFSCSSDDTDDTVGELDGRGYQLTSFNINTAVDLNADQVFSNNLMEELEDNCIGGNTLGFRNNEVNAPLEYVVFLSIRNAETANPTQEIGCGIIDYFTLFNYSVENNILSIGEDNSFIGIINENTITFNINSFGAEIGQFFNEAGLIETYQGSVELVYTLIE